MHSNPKTTLAEFAKYICQRQNLQYFEFENKIYFYIQDKDSTLIDLSHSLSINLFIEKYGYIFEDFAIFIHYKIL